MGTIHGHTPALRDLQGFEDVYRAHAGFVAAVVSRFGLGAAAVPDAVQDVFVVAYRRWGDLEPGRPLRPWLVGIARKVAFRHRRTDARRYRKAAALAQAHPDRTPGPEGPAVARQFLDLFVGALPESHREVWLLAEFEGLTAPEIAERLDLSTDAVYGRLKQARRRLRRAVEAHAEEPDPKAAALVPAWGLVLEQLTLSTGLEGAGASVVANQLGKVVAFVAAASTVAVIGVGLQREKSASTVSNDAQEVRVREPGEAPTSVLAAAAKEPPPVIEAAPMVDGVEQEMRAKPRRVEEAHDGPVPDPRDPLTRETELLRRASTAASGGDPARALELLSTHAREFPRGQLATARQRARIRALCDLGKARQARGEAQRLAAQHPGEPLAQQALHICARSG